MARHFLDERTRNGPTQEKCSAVDKNKSKGAAGRCKIVKWVKTPTPKTDGQAENGDELASQVSGLKARSLSEGAIYCNFSPVPSSFSRQIGVSVPSPSLNDLKPGQSSDKNMSAVKVISRRTRLGVRL